MGQQIIVPIAQSLHNWIQLSVISRVSLLIDMFRVVRFYFSAYGAATTRNKQVRRYGLLTVSDEVRIWLFAEEN